jgi:SNF2 family DNA or RNA helicase
LLGLVVFGSVIHVFLLAICTLSSWCLLCNENDTQSGTCWGKNNTVACFLLLQREEIRNMIERDGSAKGIVFSQFTSFLDLIEFSLQRVMLRNF